MADEIRPALSEKEWAGLHYDGEDADGDAFYIAKWGGRPDLRSFYIMDACGPDDEGCYTDAGIALPPKARHAIAALCLHGLPEGFTWEDVDRLREIADSVLVGYPRDYIEEFRSLADRIAALLPPRPTNEDNG